jgi:3D (Asp-Asp-Asp) domain-containing protein
VILAAALLTVSATSYCQPGRMADGTLTRPGSVASNNHPLGTRLRLTRPRRVFGHRTFVVRDRIGWGSSLDFFNASCTAAQQFGRRRVSYRVVG